MEGDAQQEALAVGCNGDRELREILEGMLCSAQESTQGNDHFLSSPLETVGEPAIPDRMGDYEILSEVGRGGMGIVYRARQISLPREVAIKVLPNSWCQSKRSIDRFHLEARTLARLEHPGIVTIFAEGVDGDVHYFAMEFIRGPNLAEIICARKAPAGSLSQPELEAHAKSLDQPVRIAEIVAGAAEALQRAHDAGVVHRDVKPSNLFLTDNGKLKVGDFGMVLDEQDGAVSQTGELRGSPFYMSPEQVAGDTGRIDGRTDVYSLGVVLFELLTQSRPFGGDSAVEIMRRVEAGNAPRVRTLVRNAPPDLAIICEVAMAKDPGERYASASEMALDLRRAIALEPIKASRLPSRVRVLRWAKRHRAVLATSAALILAVSMTSAFFLLSKRTSRLLADDLNALVVMTLNWEPGHETAGAIRGSIDRLEGRISEFSPAQRAAFMGVKEKAAVAAEIAASSGMDLMDFAKRRSTGVRPWEFQSDDLLEAAARINDAGQLSGDSGLVKRLLEDKAKQTWPIEISPAFEGQNEEFTILLREIDPVLTTMGPSIPLGHDLLSVRTAPGLYCLTVQPAGCSPMDFVRLVRFGEEIPPLVVHPRPLEDQRSDMILVKPEPVTYPRVDAEAPPIHGRELVIGPYWLDKYEVCNGDYHEFVEAFPERAPALWTLDTYKASWADKPVVGVLHADATAYAEWRGKRLPTLAELIYAGRGKEGRLYPWTEAKVVEAYLGNCSLTEAKFDDSLPPLDAVLKSYLDSAAPVDSHPEAATAAGFHHLMGNVEELTCSFEVMRTSESTLRTSLDAHYIFGGSWFTKKLERTLENSVSIQKVGTHHRGVRTGFRCAISAN